MGVNSTSNTPGTTTNTRFKDVAIDKLEAKNRDVAEPENQMRIVWFNIVTFAIMHVAAFYGLYVAITSARFYTTFFAYILANITGLGITAGAHRLWSHRAYKATWQLQVLLMLLNCMAFQEPVIRWSRDHRLHHKYSETDADPHNATRGFFFAHVGWLLTKKHSQVKKKGKTIDMSDLQENPILAFQQRYYAYLVPWLTFVFPTVVPVYLWGETWWNSVFVAAILRYVYSMNMTFLVNSAAHIFGGKPYDKTINPAENKLVGFVAMGEGWHNYHHVFPWDYKAAELGNYRYNLTTAFIDLFARIGWAYDLKAASPENVKSRVIRTGDGSHPIWGWGDKDQCDKERKSAIFINASSEKN